MLPPQPTRRRWAVVAAVPWVAWAGLRLTGSERGFPLVPAMSFTPYAAASAVVPLAVAARQRSAAGTALAAGAGAALAAAVLGRAGRREPEHAGGPRVRVATVSLRRGLVPAGPVLDLVRRLDVDVLAVQELTPRAEAALRAEGLDEVPALGARRPRPAGLAAEAASGAVWTRLDVRARTATPGAFEQPTVRLATRTAPEFELTSVHTLPPATSPAAVRGWTADLAALPDPDPAVPRILAGDFNATLDHAALRALLRRGYADAVREAGLALRWTWRPLRLRFPRPSLDHVLVDRRIAVAAVGLVTVRGSDHRAVVADLLLPR